LAVHFKQFDFDELLESDVFIDNNAITPEIDSLLSQLPRMEQIWAKKDSLFEQILPRKRMIKIAKGRQHGKHKNFFVFDTDKAPSPIIIKDGKEIDNFDSISGDGIQSLTVLKGKEAIEKYGPKGAQGVVEITSKKE